MLTTIFIILLLISQLFCFYMIALLNAKVAKFKDLEIRQEQLMQEMDESISLYLVEMREENDRLIKELSEGNSSKYIRKTEESEVVHYVEELKTNVNEDNKDSKDQPIDGKVFVPKAVAHNAYNKYKNQSKQNEPKEIDQNSSTTEKAAQAEAEEIPLSFEQQVLKLHNDGKSIEEIAKLTNKGKTEIELLLKFHA